MKRLIMIISAIASMGFGVAATTAPSMASNCAIDDYDHNGSLMEIEYCDGSMRIEYITPRAGMLKAGARSGSLLVDARIRLNGEIRGTARLFSETCGEITYPISGQAEVDIVELWGQAPVRNSNCQIVRHRDDHLVFTRKAGQQQQPQQQPQQPNAGVRDWYAIAGSFDEKAAAQAHVNRLNGELGNAQTWYILNTLDCPNFTNGYWIATVGPLSKSDAGAWSEWTGQGDAYSKTCN